jgi:hypothetical protein
MRARDRPVKKHTGARSALIPPRRCAHHAFRFLNPFRRSSQPMPTLTRFLKTIVLVGLAGYAVVAALATLVEPRTRPMREPLDSRIIREAGQASADG